MAAAMATTSFRVISLHTNAIRFMLVSLSSLEKPSSEHRFLRITSPSNTSTRCPFSLRSFSTLWAMVDFPELGSPVNHTVAPFATPLYASSQVRFYNLIIKILESIDYVNGKFPSDTVAGLQKMQFFKALKMLKQVFYQDKQGLSSLYYAVGAWHAVPLQAMSANRPPLHICRRDMPICVSMVAATSLILSPSLLPQEFLIAGLYSIKMPYWE